MAADSRPAGLADRAVRPDYARYVARERLGLEPIEIDHSPFLSAPRLLADLLLAIEARRRTGVSSLRLP